MLDWLQSGTAIWVISWTAGLIAWAIRQKYRIDTLETAHAAQRIIRDREIKDVRDAQLVAIQDMRNAIAKLVDRLEVLPRREWFDEAGSIFRRMPDIERLDEHYKLAHQLRNDLGRMMTDTGNLKEEVRDIKVALRQVEDRVARNEGRMETIAGRRGTGGVQTGESK